MKTYKNVMATIGTILVIGIMALGAIRLANGWIKFKYVKPNYLDYKTNTLYCDDIEYYTLKDLVDHHKIIKMQGYEFSKIVF